MKGICIAVPVHSPKQPDRQPVRKLRLTEALQRLVQLYEATDNKDEAAKWRKELDEMKATGKEPSKK